jgi:hypothetical protein
MSKALFLLAMEAAKKEVDSSPLTDRGILQLGS